MSWSGFLSSVTDVTGVKVSEEGLKGFASYLTDHAKAAVNTLESTISSTVDTAQVCLPYTARDTHHC